MVAVCLGVCLQAGCLPAVTPPTPTPSPLPPTATATIPFPTAAPTITATPPPSMTPTQDPRQALGPVIYATDFNDAGAWPLGRDVYGVTSLESGQLTVVVNRPNQLRTIMSPVGPLGDFYVEVALHTSLCQTGDEFGLVFRVNPIGEQYRLTITCDGGLRLRRVLAGAARGLVPFIDSEPAVMPHAPADNVLAILARGPDLEIFVNGVSVLSAHDVALPVGKIGFIVSAGAGGQTTVSFDDFEIRSLNPEVPTPVSMLVPRHG
jgi:hypothetical protein